MNRKVFTKTTEKINGQKAALVLFVAIAMLVSAAPAKAQSVVYIGSSRTWASSLPGTCTNCTINLSPGVVLTIDQTVVCQNCSFKGGTISMKSGNLDLQFTGNSPLTTSFNGTNLLVNGDNSTVQANSPLSLSNSTFTFSNTTSFKTIYALEMTASRINIYDNAVMLSTGSEAISMSQSSQIMIGNGVKSSTATMTVNGPTLDAYDNSSVVLGNDNNAYNNWSGYKTATSSGAALKSFTTAGSTINCGAGYSHNCSSLSFYGPATLSSAGPSQGNILPILLVGFSAGMNNDKTISLNWDTKEETNFSLFTIERSADGSVWSPIGTIQPAGNSSVQSDYVYTDKAPLAGVNYYRIKMTDLDHRYGYTQLKIVRYSMINNISFYPNPARDYVNISLGDNNGKEMTVRLVNQAGQVLQEKRMASGNGSVVSFPIQQYNTGMYILSVTGDDGKSEINKLLIRHS